MTIFKHSEKLAFLKFLKFWCFFSKIWRKKHCNIKIGQGTPHGNLIKPHGHGHLSRSQGNLLETLCNIMENPNQTKPTYTKMDITQ